MNIENPRSRGTYTGTGGNEQGQTCPHKIYSKRSQTNAFMTRGSLLPLL